MKQLLKIGVTLLVAGICLAALGRIFGGSFSFSINPKTHEFADVRDDDDYYAQDSMSLDAFTSLDIRTGVADIDIKEGDSYQLEYILYKEDKPTVSTDGETLVIKSKENNHTVHIGFDFEVFDFKARSDKEPQLTLTVPKGTKLKDVSIFTESGDCQFSNINVDKLSVKTEAGDMVLDNIDSSTMNMVLESGDAKIKACSFDSCTLKSEAGDVVVSDVDSTAMDMTLESGDVRIDGCDFASWELLSEAGDVKAGELTVDKLSAKAESGDVELGIEGEQEEYGFALFCDSGDIKLNGRNQGENFIYAEEKDKLIKVENECGDVTISFD